MTAPKLNVIGAHEDGRRAANVGYDHGWYAWSPLPARPAGLWPGGATIAVSVVLDLGAVEWESAGPGPVPPSGGRGLGEYPDVPRMSHREFGHRVGVFRLLDVLTARDIPFAAAADVVTVECYGSLVQRLRPYVGEWIAAGISASRPLTSLMSEDEERHYIATALDRLERGLGVRPNGWLSPERSQSVRTPGLLADAGARYVADFCNDELPYPMSGPADHLWAFPLSWELSDVSAMFHRQVLPTRYASSLVEAVEVMCDDAARGTGRMLGVQLSPWLSGQAFRAGPVEEALDMLARDDRVWLATPQQVLDHYRNQS
jgi:allantoinase